MPAVSAMADHLAPGDHDDLIGQVDDPLLMGDDDDGVLPGAVEHAEGLRQFGKGPQVDARLRLVKDEQAAGPGQDGGDLNALDLPAGEGGVHLPVHVVGRAQPHPVQVGAALVPGQLPLARGQLQQVPHPQPLEPGGLLEPIADPQLGPFGDGQAGNIRAVPDNLAAGGLGQAHDGLGQGGLAAAVGAGDDDKLIVFNGQVDAPEDFCLHSVVLHLIGKSFQFQHIDSSLSLL